MTLASLPSNARETKHGDFVGKGMINHMILGCSMLRQIHILLGYV